MCGVEGWQVLWPMAVCCCARADCPAPWKSWNLLLTWSKISSNCFLQWISFRIDVWAGHFFALISIPTSKYYFKMWHIWISLICLLLSAFAKVNNSSPTSHQERVKSRREEAERVLLPIWSGKQNVSISQIGAEIVLLPFWAWLYHWKAKALFKTCQCSLWSLKKKTFWVH